MMLVVLFAHLAKRRILQLMPCVALVVTSGLRESSAARPSAKEGRKAVTTRPAEPRAGNVALASAPPQKTVLSLPVTGVWGILQGANSQGTHQGYAAFAYDFVPAEKPVSEAVFRSRTRLADHPCYGRPVLAPADGRVVWARDGARELLPFKEGKRHEAGNFVILQHAPDEFTEFRHLQRGSVAVHEGDTVHAGQQIGRCGNSGNARTPHLHFAFLGSYQPIATRPVQLSSYEVMAPDGTWRPGDGDLQPGQILRSLAAVAGE
jgi:murein DD-endopeptidase MepM/ murein hydrolase activator NlpD